MKSFRSLAPAVLALFVLAGVCAVAWRPAQSPREVLRPEPSRPARPVKFVSASRERVAEIDARASGAFAPAPDRIAAMESLRKEVPGTVVEFDPVSGAPSFVQATGRFLSKPLAPGQAGRVAVERFIDQHAALFGHGAEALRKARVVREDHTRHSGLQTLVWNQEVDGVPLFKTILKASLSAKGEVVAINDHFMRDPETATGLPEAQRRLLIAQPPVSAPRAIQLAAASVRDSVTEAQIVAQDPPQGTAQRQRFSAPGVSDTTAQLTYLPMDADTLTLAWDVTTFSLANNEMFRIVVDASTGAVLNRTSLTTDISDATYRVYADATTKKPFDSPNPMMPGTPTPSGAQASEVLRNLVTLQALDTTASPNGWINDGGMETVGNNVDAHTDTNADNAADLPRPNGGATRVFDFACDLTLAPSAYKDAAVTHLFYMNNWMHDKLYGLGFTESAGNFQTNNFGRGGNGNDAVQADAQDGNGTNNANFSTPSDGSPGRMQMYVFTGPNPDRDGDFDDIVVLHEYAHGLSNRLVGGGVGMSALQSRGMGEGWSDFYGMALLADPASDPNAVYPGGSYATLNFVAGMTTNYYYGIRRYPYCTDMAKNPLTYRDIDATQASPHTGVPLSPLFTSSNSNPSEFHNQGEVWCMVLWEGRANLMAKLGGTAGSQKMLQLVTDGMKIAPVNPTMLQARDAIIQADLVSTGGTNAKELWAAFAKRGMGLGATSPASSTTTGVLENFDVPDDLSVTPIAAVATSGTRLTGPFSPATHTFTLANVGTQPLSWTASKTQPWTSLSATSGTLAVGASITVTLTLDEPMISALTTGSYADTVSFTNTSDGALMLRTVNLTVNPYLTPVASFDLNSDPGWSRQGEWAFGTPTGGGSPYADPTSGATGTKVFGINLNGAYNTTVSGYAYLTAGPFNLTDVSGATLRFSRWLNVTGQTSVYNTVDVSTNGSSWTNVWNNGTTTIQDTGWSTQSYGLGAAVDHQATVYVRWGHSVATAGSTARGGWNLDDIQILGESQAPTVTAIPQTLVTALNVPVTLTLSGVDSTNPSAPLTYTVATGPTNGTLTGTAPGLTYTPNLNFFGMDSLSFVVSNGTSTSAPALVTIQVLPGPPEISVEQPLGTGLTDGVSTVAFGNVVVGATAVKQFVIKNLGTGPLTFGTVTIDGTYAGEFSAGALSASSLQPGDTAFLNVTLRPVFVSGKTAMLHIASDDADEPVFDIALTGSALVYGDSIVTPGGTVNLVKDINALPAGLSPTSLLTIGGVTYFSGATLDLGAELWRTDGTMAGTYMVKDINSGSQSSSPGNMTNVNGTLFFTATTSTGGIELWKSDGTQPGTVLVKDIFSGVSSSFPTNLTVVGSTLFFAATDGVNGTELWKSDGTTVGTVMVKDINTTGSNVSSSPTFMVNLAGVLVFAANDGVNGTELWKSDGTTSGTVLVKDITSGSTSSSFSGPMLAIGGTVYFGVNDGVNGAELWKTDGTTAGTVLVKDINAGSSSSTPGNLTNLGGTLFFAALDAAGGTELWKSDGTTAGTVQVKDIYAGSSGSNPTSFAIINGVLYFAATDAVNGRELWKSDGTTGGTVLVKDIYSGSSSSSPAIPVVVGSTLYFSATTAAGNELWKSDGTAVGTMLVKDINPGSGSGFSSVPVALGSSVLFAGNDGLAGPELWKSDGTAAGTVQVLEGMTGTQTGGLSNLRNINGVLYFAASDGSSGTELWKSDGTTTGTTMVKDIFAGFSSSNPSGFAALGSVTLFAAQDNSSGSELWRTDGSANGTVLVKDILAGGVGSSPASLTTVGSVVFFSANDGTNGTELWKSDGTASGTVLVKDINTTAGAASNISNVMSFNGMLFFSATDGVNGQELWKSDGTSTGTVMVADINAGSASASPINLRVVGSTLFFTATTAANGAELWKSDGTAGGTVMVADIASGTTSSSPASFGVIGSTLYFNANNSTAGTELWKSDGTTVGTVMVKDIFSGSSSSSPSSLVTVGSTLYFAAMGDTTTGRELWKSDGTAGGTVMVKDISASGLSSNPTSLVTANGMIFFVATDAIWGTEVWKSDGTAGGTVLACDVLQGSASSSPANLTVVGNKVFFTARGNDLGASELFMVDAGAAAEIAVEQPAGTGLTDGVSSVWWDAQAAGTSVTKTFVVQNLGAQPLTITSVTIDGAEAASFAPLMNYVGTMLAPGGSTTLGVVFVPATDGLASAALHIGCNDADENPFDVALSGTGMWQPAIVIEQPAGTVRYSGTSVVSMGDTSVGVPVTRTFTVRNSGTSDLHVAGVSFSGTAAGDFSAGAVPATIAAGDTTTFDVTFTPTVQGARRAVMTVASDAPDQPSFNVSLSGLGAIAQGPLKLARDINSQGAPAGITTMAMLGSTLIFTANDPTTGTELWKSDGTPGGTVLLKDINTGTTSSSPANFTVIGSTLFFTATDSTNGTELWKTDGTAVGTMLVKDIFTGVSNASPSLLVNVAGTLLFIASDAATGQELWKSDGTTAGTVQVKDILSGASSSSITQLTALGSTLFFSASDGVNGTELWKSDGTTLGTVMVKDIHATAGVSSSPTGLTVMGGMLYFSASDGVNGVELWKSDGTSTGTVMVADIYSNVSSSSPAGFVVSGSTLFFRATTSAAGTELWKSDGTTVGTVMVKDINAGASNSTPSLLVANGSGGIYFTATDGVNGTEVWKSDGTTGGTVMVADINAGSASSSPSTLTMVNGVVWFSATTAASGTELWRSDGTALGTTMLRELNPGTLNASPLLVTPSGTGSFYFIASDGPDGIELWQSDGSATGTSMIKDIVPGSASSTPASLRAMGDKVLFVASDGINSSELWSSDGTTTALVKDINPGSASSSILSPVVIEYLPSDVLPTVRTFYFSATDGVNGQELWKSDGTPAGTMMVKDILPGSNSSSPFNLTNVSGRLFFTAQDAASGSELWTSDGTSSGTVMVANIAAGAASSSPSSLTAVGSTLFFVANDGINGSELWKSDGTSMGTSLVKDLTPGSTSTTFGSLAACNGRLFFVANDGQGAGSELWVSDGSTAGTSLVKDINPGTAASSITSMTAWNDVLYFSATDGVNGLELWRSDGTTAGTWMVRDIQPGASSSSPTNLLAAGSRLYFTASDGITFTELWRTDGTAAGTVLVKDINPGAVSSSPGSFALLNGVLFFSATGSSTQGAELWRSDGTAAGTALVADLRPAAALSSSPNNLVAVGSTLFFAATGADMGSELWTLDTAATPEIAVFDGTGTSGAERQSGTGVVNFGSISSPAAQSFTIKNTSTGTLYVSDIVVTGPGAAAYVVPNKSDVTTAIGAGVTATFSVTALPVSLGTQAATVTILSNDADEAAFTIALTAAVVDTTPPVISAPATYRVGQPGVFAMPVPDVRGLVSYTDNVAAPGAITQSPAPGTGSLSVGQSVTVNFTATDTAGNDSNTVSTVLTMGLGQIDNGALVTATAGSAPGSDVLSGDPSVGVLKVQPMSDGGWIVGGKFGATFTLGAGVDQTSLVTAGLADVFIARYRPDGTLAWARKGGGASADTLTALAVMSDGSIVMGGGFTTSITFGTTTLTAGTLADFYLVRYLADGTLSWARAVGGTGADYVHTIVEFSDGSVAAAGVYGTTTTLNLGNSITISNLGGTGNDFWLAKFNRADGVTQWARSLGGVSSESPTAYVNLVPLPGGAMALGGVFVSPVLSFSGSATTLTNTGADFFVARYDGSGTLQWARHSSNAVAGVKVLGGLAATAAGDVVLAGTATTTLTFGPGEAAPVTLSALGSGADVIYASFRGDTGALRWAGRGGSVLSDTCLAPVVLPDNSVVIAGSFQGGSAQFGVGEAGAVTLTSLSAQTDAFVARLNGLSGALLWAHAAGGNLADGTSALTATADGDVALAGTFGSTTAAFWQGEPGLSTLSNLNVATPSQDIYVAKLRRNDGTLAWAQRGGGSGTEAASSLATLTNGNVVLAGTFASPSVVFGPGETNQTTLTNADTAANTDLFLALFNAGGAQPPTAPVITAQAATGLSATTMTFNAAINSQGLATTVSIDYGSTTSYGTTVNVAAVNAGLGTETRSVTLTGLSPLTSRHFRVTATNAVGTTVSSDAVVTTYSDAEIAVEEPAGTNRTDNVSVLDFGAVALGSSATRTITIRNVSASGTLTGLARSIDGAAAADYAASALTVTSLAPGASTTFTVTYTPSVVGARAAALHITSNDGDESPFDLALTGDNAFTATFGSADDVVVTSNGYTVPAGRTLMLNLGYVPAMGEVLTVVNNTGPGAVSGTFLNLPQNGIVSGTFGGQTCLFQIRYDGGDGNDITLGESFEWTWRKGAMLGNQSGTYGSQNSGSALNTPGGRSGAMSWTDAQGNLWLFGGNGYSGSGSVGYLNDLWRYNKTTHQWTWVKGSNLSAYLTGSYGTQGVASSTNTPGSRTQGMTWVDASGKLWLFGGTGYGAVAGIGNLNDLWSFDTATNLWTWVAGSSVINTNGTYGTQGTAAVGNTPGSRYGGAAWVDTTGALWLFGGMGLGASGTTVGALNDVWRFDVATGLWTWMKGSSANIVAGVFGTQGVSAPANTPGGRHSAACWRAADGRVWLFGGNGYGSSTTGVLNDLWRYNPATNEWTWLSGASNPAVANGSYGPAAQYGPTFAPGGRQSAAAWTDTAGRLWLFGGNGYAVSGTTTAQLNDLWCLDPVSAQWAWLRGSKTAQASTNYGVQGQPSTINTPGAREYPAAFPGNAAATDLWLFGGLGYTSTSTIPQNLNDLWTLDLPGAPLVTTTSPSNLVFNAAWLTASVNANSFLTQVRFRYGTAPDLSGAAWSEGNNIVGNAPVISTDLIQGLTPGTTCYFQAVATNFAGTTSGSILSFTTPQPPDISIEQPVGTVLTNGSASVGLGTVVMQQSSSLTFTLKNTGPSALTDIVANITGTQASDFAVGTLPSSLAAAGTATFVVSFTPSASGIRNASLQVASNDPDENPFVISLTGTGQSAGDAWRLANFGTTSNSGDAADDADPDHDGLKNLIEFAFNSNPNAPNNSVQPVATSTVNPADGKHYLTLTYRRRIVPGTLTYSLQSTTNLTTWTTIPPGSLSQIGSPTPTGDGVTEFVTVSVLPAIEDDATPCFVHLSVSP